MTVLEIFMTLEASYVGDAIRNSLWLFPVIEAFHLVGFAFLGGSVLIVDLRLVGLCLQKRTIADVFRSMSLLTRLSLVLIFATGIPLALSEMIKLYYNYSFWVKMSALALALIFTFAIRNPLARKDNLPQVGAIFVGLISFSLWFTVAAAGRWIGFSS
ncbi:MAG: hypothetical protein OXC80_08320 [Gammaproteobacteria bacterium]|nr:hypothetical protein [Gammaproteobacteria bacterium]